ncbi:MAG TPA: hypothetical protein DEA96_07860 [Leptospiraceae bacterium]|nr:hypothetical protein [Spirochaetaceae bacterium]HBS04862.1 hypothetical protein [Leptospiraceae bacterium]|tara:strand:+ start:46205 stop:47458 length:1254 start_codon:yes stop_codon:yes gene_type:complete
MKGIKMLKSAAALIAVSALTAQCSFLGLEEEEDDSTALLAALALTACNQDTQTLSGEIRGLCTLGGDGVTVTLSGTAFVESGAVLTILPGSIVKGSSGAALYVKQGGRIIAEGTSSKPIVFTSNKDVGSRAPQDWGGIVLVGNAPISETQTLKTEDNVQTPYGGNNSADSSGVLKYVRVEFGSYEFSTGKEWNAYSFYAVGSGTTLEYLQSLMAADDAFEFFGGAANASYLLSVGTSDDDVDVDEGYKGTISYVFAYRYTNALNTFSSDPRAFELDGGKATATASTRSDATIQNFSMYDPTGSLRLGTVRDCAKITFSNGQVYNYNTSGNANFVTSSSDCSAVASEMTCSSFTANGARTSITGGACATDDASIQTKIVTTEKVLTAGNEAQVPTLNATTAGLGGTDWTSGWANWRWN